jgi:hypothetical protein
MGHGMRGCASGWWHSISMGEALGLISGAGCTMDKQNVCDVIRGQQQQET